jgi:hypothetical protein
LLSAVIAVITGSLGESNDRTIRHHEDAIRYAADFSRGSVTGGIQEAINSLPPDGGIVFLPAGITTITKPIVIKRPVILRGVGMGMLSTKNYAFSNPSTIKSNITQSHAVIITPPSSGYLGGVVLEDFQIHGNKDVEPDPSGCGVALIGGNSTTALRSVVISRVLSRDNADCGFLVQDNAFMVTFREVQSLRNQIDGIRITSTETGGKPSQIWIHDTISDLNGRDALRIAGKTGDVSIFGGSFSDSGQNGLTLDPTVAGPLVTHGVHFESNTNIGINLRGGRGHVISGNFIGANQMGVFIDGDDSSAVSAVVEGNSLESNKIGIVVGPKTHDVLIGVQSTSEKEYGFQNEAASTRIVQTAQVSRTANTH